MKPDDKLYGIENQETLCHSPDEVVSEALDSACVTPGEPFAAIADRIDWPINILVYRRMDVTRYAKNIATQALENALELLDEEHSDPGGDSAEPTQAMKDAAEAFGKAITSEYVSWACEPSGEVIKVTREQVESEEETK